ncbi:Rieske (2Fe-2S) protein [Novosphingobium album (ex Liu et al. 2023)]|uniref:Rieske 2Fe-2S domain-containing protein n=1 Tax=Novosphingobium album (ex Liu et al. 2023) TaxID=3031130 RepID=A0ABT5WS70_9SPHN|nr:Rieske 2Fe-2S domain-containing protein [Novosphingobium album (ex Liu et al. 2023)]MDE8652882.1 Rieske 2Fe-2S domain-containing protein [Novosphingobium album (ex Liu et al. 2023)]
MTGAVFAICAAQDIPNRRAVPFVLARRDGSGTVRPWPIFVLRWGRNVRAYENRCPHQDTNLDWERGEFLDGAGTRIQCGKHGALFDLGSGECVEGPCLGARLAAIDVSIDAEGDICLAGGTLVEDDDVDSGQGLE